ncbi:c-type cytochrome biogenesis protein CcmI [Paraglaciecola sp. MB-3u-78]|uniref:c-type cytochrome biogenesis protein CcmI n=1 Tax=Paraglaciecola sp. MB-3u-78 TaxID=2058332 RepID=UPI000C342E88|nr:c-type cytochrome biogenesis protein CcmI [Paraglaciecola sp. MB-3u-78]PKG98896.1 c-type cytochrome biogenesis protein CcmI [Paraglaciecola sp. MB-3u-78]
MSLFYLGAVLSFVIFLMFILFPWFTKSPDDTVSTLTNKSLIKQRLTELHTEQQQGLLSDTDRLQSENELKLALLDETKTSQSNETSVGIPLAIGALVSLSVGIGVYLYSNQIQRIDQWQMAQQQTSELGQRMIKGDENLNLKDLQTFALGLRTKLVDTPEDATGWMLLGRVSGAINRLDSAIQAFEKSLQYDPNNIGTLSSYAQALLMTGQEQQVFQAKQVLLQILDLEPDNTNAMGVLAIAASELGDKALALENWQRLVAFIPDSDPNNAAVNQRILQLQTELDQDNQQVAQNQSKVSTDNLSTTRVSLTINISDELQAKLPGNGFLFVFAQESSGQVKMPAAVVKMPLGEFPVVVELSNDNAMTPNYTLSQLQQAKLVARVSIDGIGTQSAGDFQGELLVTLSANEMTQETITIDREL